MSEPLAFFITWTTFGTWLPGDERGWIKSAQPGIQPPNIALKQQSRQRMRHSPVVLNSSQRQVVEGVIRRHCQIRQWELHAMSVRTNHVHVVVAADEQPERVMEQFKAWASRRLNEGLGTHAQPGVRRKWWTEHGSTRWIKTQPGLDAAIEYVNERQ